MQDMTAAFEDDVTEALIPFVDKTFRTIADRDHRAMAGLSMGGMQTFHITLNHLDLFSHIGGFSGAGGASRWVATSTRRPTTTACSPTRPRSRRRSASSGWASGTAEPERMREGIRKLHASLTEAGIKHVYRSRPARTTSGRPGGAISRTLRRGSSARSGPCGNGPQALTRERQLGAPCGAAKHPERLAAPQAQRPASQRAHGRALERAVPSTSDRSRNRRVRAGR